MAIKVIKHGEKKFQKICPICGCIFEYEYEDLEDYFAGYPYHKRVRCPDCGEVLDHKEEVSGPHNIPGYPDPVSPWDPITKPYITWYTSGTGTVDCETCPNKPDPNKPAQVGDTPCTWCKKNQPYCFTGDKFPGDYKGGSYKTNPEDFKNVTYTSSSSTAPNINGNFTTDIK